MIKSADIIEIFESPEFTNELDHLNSYAANIRQERPLVFLFAKYFWTRNRHKFALEGRYPNSTNKCDLIVDETTIEFKVHLDCDLVGVKRELLKYDNDLNKLWADVCAKKLSRTFPRTPRIYEDVFIKKPDIFIWVLCSRDISNATEDDLSRMVLSIEQKKYNRHVPFDPKGEHLGVARNLLDCLNSIRPFELEQATVVTNGDFPCAYHLFVCEFTGTGDSPAPVQRLGY